MNKYKVLTGEFEGHKEGEIFRTNYTRAVKRALKEGILEQVDAEDPEIKIVSDDEFTGKLQSELDAAKAEIQELTAMLETANKLEAEFTEKIKGLEAANAGLQSELDAALKKKK